MLLQEAHSTPTMAKLQFEIKKIGGNPLEAMILRGFKNRAVLKLPTQGF
jgi:hypothetical protein